MTDHSILSCYRQAVEIALRAGQRALIGWSSRGANGAEAELKTSAVDLVTATDRAVEQQIIQDISRVFPADPVLGEETAESTFGWKLGKMPRSWPGRVWIVDPIDGTTNFVHGLPQWCVSIGLWIDSVPTIGVIYNPVAGELFGAWKGGGAWLNGRPIHPNRPARLSESLLVTGFGYDRRERLDYYVGLVREMLEGGRELRRLGSAALDLCFVACGRIDVYIEQSLKPWDVAAGRLIVDEAGGRVTDFRGDAPHLATTSFIASGGSLAHDEAIRRFAPHFPEWDVSNL